MATHLVSKLGGASTPPRRSAPFDEEPGYYPDAALWLYGNARLLRSSLFHLPACLGRTDIGDFALDSIERQCESAVLEGKVLVTGIHNLAHQRAAVVPLRWGAPRILVLSGGFYHHLGTDLRQEPFRAARLWRYEFDGRTDLAISRRAPDRLPTFAHLNPTVDRLVERIVYRRIHGLLFEIHS